MKISRRRFYKTSRGRAIVLGVVVFLLALFIASAVGANIWYKNQLKPVSADTTKVTFKIEEGQLPSDTASQLKEKQLIRSSQAFLWFVRNNSLTNKLQAGTYELSPSKSTQEIANILASGKVSSRPLTILPGKRIDQIRQTFIDAGFLATEVDQALDPSNYRNHPALIAKPTDQSLEGYIFPETFKIDSSTTPEQIIKLSLDQLSAVLTPKMIEEFNSQGLGIHRAITLASIVEKEAANNSEKPVIASVFLNRLKIGMPLQSDPTYKYAAFIKGLAPNPEIDSPYNTYRVVGLPPGPISNTSKASLEAVARPAQTDYLYFVAGDDKITRFSKTLEEHQALVKQYCIKKCSTF